MHRFSALWLIAIVLLTALFGCSNDPITPRPEFSDSLTSQSTGVEPVTHLWGLYQVHIDTVEGEVTAILDRSAMFTANVVNFLNSNPMSMGFNINDIISETDHVDVDIDVALTHPFPGMPQYHGYDVRGVFMGDGSGTLVYNGLNHAVLDTDQFMLADPDVGNGAPDGYTRWYNMDEFSMGGMPLLAYTHGNLASVGFIGDANLNPYRYFADGLGYNEDLWTWLLANPGQYGVFSSGATNVRNYYLRFPTPEPDVTYGYAVIANWEGEDVHPSNAIEAVGCDIIDTSDAWFDDDINNGGNIILGISIFDWYSEMNGPFMDDYLIVLESTATSSPYVFTNLDMTPVSGDDQYSTYHVEIPADNLTYLEGNEYWIIIEYPDANYGNDFGVPNEAEDDNLAAYFRYDLDVTSVTPQNDPVCSVEVDTDLSPPMPYLGPATDFTFDASASYDPDGGALTYLWDFDNDGTFGDAYDSGTDDHPTKYFDFDNNEQVCVQVNDDNGGESYCCVDVDITITESDLKNIPLRNGVAALDLGVRHSNGDLFILYNDDQVWKYLLSDNYQSGTYVYTVDCNSPSHTFHPELMDVSPLGVTLFMDQTPAAIWTWRYEADGTKLAEVGLLSACTSRTMRDVATWGTEGLYADKLICLAGGYWQNTNDRMWWYNYQAPLYNTHVTWTSCQCGYGINGMYYDLITAYETDYNGENIWVLEGSPENHCTMWEFTPPGFYPNLNYDNSYFDSSTSPSNWHDPMDLARDDNNQLMMLDETGGQGIVTFWTGSSGGGTYVGQVGNSSTISEQPRRVDGSDFDGKVMVLHGDTYNSSTGYKLSVFLPSELP